MTRHVPEVTERERVRAECDICEARGITVPGPVFDYGPLNAHRACFEAWWLASPEAER